MSFHGKQYRGAAKTRREEKRQEAEARNAAANARWFSCGHIHGERRGECNRAAA